MDYINGLKAFELFKKVSGLKEISEQNFIDKIIALAETLTLNVEIRINNVLLIESLENYNYETLTRELTKEGVHVFPNSSYSFNDMLYECLAVSLNGVQPIKTRSEDGYVYKGADKNGWKYYEPPSLLLPPRWKPTAPEFVFLDSDDYRYFNFLDCAVENDIVVHVTSDDKHLSVFNISRHLKNVDAKGRDIIFFHNQFRLSSLQQFRIERSSFKDFLGNVPIPPNGNRSSVYEKRINVLEQLVNTKQIISSMTKPQAWKLLEKTAPNMFLKADGKKFSKDTCRTFFKKQKVIKFDDGLRPTPEQ